MSSCYSTFCCTDRSFSLELFLLLCQGAVDYIYVDFVFSSVASFVHSPVSHKLGYCGFVVSLDVTWCQSSNFVLQSCVGILTLFPFHINIRISSPVFTK